MINLLKYIAGIAGQMKQPFKKKKILIISDKNIVSLSFGSVTQILLIFCSVVFLFWVSHATAKYLAYRKVITQKNELIYGATKENQDLKFQLSDLYQNVKKLNTYIEYSGQFDHIDKQSTPAKSSAKSAKKDGSQEHSAVDIPVTPQGINLEVAQMIQNIDTKIANRITTLEKVITKSGLKVDRINAHYDVTKRPDSAEVQISELIDLESASAQGGPYIAIHSDDPSSFDSAPFIGLTGYKNMDERLDYLMHLESVIHALPLTKPLKESRITSRYGRRSDPFLKRPAFHYGLDFAAPIHSKIQTTAPGKVIFAGRRGAYGLMVVVDHGADITTRYGHLSKILVKKGDIVDRGQNIGDIGSTGRSTGLHLHYEVRYRNTPYDPAKFLKAGTYVYKQEQTTQSS